MHLGWLFWGVICLVGEEVWEKCDYSEQTVMSFSPLHTLGNIEWLILLICKYSERDETMGGDDGFYFEFLGRGGKVLL